MKLPYLDIWSFSAVHFSRPILSKPKSQISKLNQCTLSVVPRQLAHYWDDICTLSSSYRYYLQINSHVPNDSNFLLLFFSGKYMNASNRCTVVRFWDLAISQGLSPTSSQSLRSRHCLEGDTACGFLDQFLLSSLRTPNRDFLGSKILKAWEFLGSHPSSHREIHTLNDVYILTLMDCALVLSSRGNSTANSSFALRTFDWALQLVRIECDSIIAIRIETK